MNPIQLQRLTSYRNYNNDNNINVLLGVTILYVDTLYVEFCTLFIELIDLFLQRMILCFRFLDCFCKRLQLSLLLKYNRPKYNKIQDQCSRSARHSSTNDVSSTSYSTVEATVLIALACMLILRRDPSAIDKRTRFFNDNPS